MIGDEVLERKVVAEYFKVGTEWFGWACDVLNPCMLSLADTTYLLLLLLSTT